MSKTVSMIQRDRKSGNISRSIDDGKSNFADTKLIDELFS